MARSVEDLVLAMKVWLTSKQKRWDYDGTAPTPSFNTTAYESDCPLRIGMVVTDDFFPACDASRRSVLEAAEALRSRGHVVIEIQTKNSSSGASGTNPLGEFSIFFYTIYSLGLLFFSLYDFGRLLFLNDETDYWFLYYQYLLLLAIFYYIIRHELSFCSGRERVHSSWFW
jgi:Asp-tRNA(Asn)/Glu-tRNA(Gln) amidotransferase A subunit family amidase